MTRNYSHVQPVQVPVENTTSRNTDVWGGIPDSAFANMDSILLRHTGIRGIQHNPYHTRNSYAGVNHHPTSQHQHMNYYQNPTSYQSPQLLRETITHPFNSPARHSTTIQVNLPQFQPNIVSTARRLSPDYYGTINDDAFLTIHIPEPQINVR